MAEQNIIEWGQNKLTAKKLSQEKRNINDFFPYEINVFLSFEIQKRSSDHKKKMLPATIIY
jgi:hypothetical protein